MIVVAGSTGTVGRALLARLAAAGVATRAFAGDVTSPETIGSELAGGTAVVSTISGFAGHRGGPAAVDGQGNANLIEAADAAGVERFVLVSIAGARPDHQLELYRAKHLAEERLRASRMAWVVVRPTVIMETWLGIVGDRVARSGKAMVFGGGRNLVNFVAAGDIVSLIERALEPSTPSGTTLEAAGPENLSLEQFVAEVARASGRSTSVGRVPVPVLKALLPLALRVNPTIGRMIGTSIFMDTAKMDAPPAPGCDTSLRVLATASYGGLRRA